MKDKSWCGKTDSQTTTKYLVMFSLPVFRILLVAVFFAHFGRKRGHTPWAKIRPLDLSNPFSAYCYFPVFPSTCPRKFSINCLPASFLLLLSLCRQIRFRLVVQHQRSLSPDTNSTKSIWKWNQKIKQVEKAAYWGRKMTSLESERGQFWRKQAKRQQSGEGHPILGEYNNADFMEREINSNPGWKRGIWWDYSELYKRTKYRFCVGLKWLYRLSESACPNWDRASTAVSQSVSQPVSVSSRDSVECLLLSAFCLIVPFVHSIPLHCFQCSSFLSLTPEKCAPHGSLQTLRHLCLPGWSSSLYVSKNWHLHASPLWQKVSQS